MAGTTLVRTFLHNVCTTLQDISPQFFRWPERELVVYANYAQMTLGKFLPHVGSRTDAIKLAPGSRQDLSRVLAANIKPGDGSTAADTYGIGLLDITRNMGADGLTPGRIVRVSDRYVQDSADPDWHTTSGTVVREYLFDRNLPRQFYAVPPVHASTAVWVEVRWRAEPPRIPDGGPPGTEIYASGGASTALMGIPDQVIEDAHNYVVAVALLKGSKNTANLPKAQMHASMFLTSVNTQVELLTGTNPNLKMLPFIDSIPERS